MQAQDEKVACFLSTYLLNKIRIGRQTLNTSQTTPATRQHAASFIKQIGSPSKQQPYPRNACMRRTSTTASLSGDSFLLNSNWIKCLSVPWPRSASDNLPSPSSNSTPSPSLREAFVMQRPPRYVNFTALPVTREAY